MKISNFLFPESRSPNDDGRVIRETVEEARLTDRLGYDVIWLGEHHFDGICAYVDPVSFAAALATSTSYSKIGFAVAQMALHHPIRLAEQVSMIDQLTEGRMIVGMGRGTAYNIYDYQGYGIDPQEAQERFEEAEAVMRRAWTGEPLDHRGKYFTLKLPALRPSPFSKPHPPIIRAAATEQGMIEIARRREPFMLNIQSDATIAGRLRIYREIVANAGAAPDEIEALVGQCWAWRNVVVAETDAEAERIAIPAFHAMNMGRTAMREKVAREQGLTLGPATAPGGVPHARETVEHGLVCGSPETVAHRLAPLAATGLGGLIITFRLGPMTLHDTAQSLTLFRDQVAPALQRTA